MTNGIPTFCLAFYLTGVHFRAKLQPVDHVGEQKIKSRPIRTREKAGVRLQGVEICCAVNESLSDYFVFQNF